MNDVEIESLLEEAGYRFDAASKLYLSVEDKTAEGLGSEYVADELEIPLEDLQRWEEERQEA